MKLFTFISGNDLRLGLVVDDAAHDITSLAPNGASTCLTIGELAELSLEATKQPVVDLQDIRFGPAVVDPQKILCIGLNYRRHAEETNSPIPDYPVVFAKFANSLVGQNAKVSPPADDEKIDYEAELGVVIGRVARHVSVDAALDYVLGYCTVNDLSARGLQSNGPQWTMGKALDGFLPVGPYLVSSDAVLNPQDLEISMTVNGKHRQTSSTADMIFSVAEVISYLSRYMTLKPGDLIITGTPEGVAMGIAPPPWLKEGDVCVAEVQGLGALTTILDAPS